MEVPSADVVRLVEAHLLESGLQESVRALQNESGIKMSGQLVKNYAFHASAGNWGAVLESLSYVDPNLVVVVPGDDDEDNNDETSTRPKTQSCHLRELIAEVHEMTILELAEAGDLALAYATYRVVQKELEKSDAVSSSSSSVEKHSKKKKKKKSNDRSESEPPLSSAAAPNMSRARLLEQKLAALAAWAANHRTTNSSSTASSGGPLPLPRDYYGPTDRSKQERRDEIGRRLDEAIPLVPKQRLTSLLQQAVMWQAHTGQLPTVQRLWHGDNDDNNDENDDNEKRKKKKKKRRSHRKEFDLVLGTAMVESVPVGGAARNRSKTPVEPTAAAPWSTVKLGKRIRPESAAFLPNGKGLVTGSSDGLIEVWDAASQYTALMDSLEYQKKEELMGHDGPDAGITALVVSNDGHVLVSADAAGHVKVWNLETGRCLRTFHAHSRAVTCLGLAPDASHLLTGSRDGTCREFGLRTSRMLKEFGVHGSAAASSVAHCAYHVLGNDTDHDEDPDARRLLIVTASSDGAVRIWDRSSQDLIRTLRPMSMSVVGNKSSTSSLLGSSMVVADAVASAGNDHAVGSPPIQAVLELHTPPGTMIVVPRGPRAFLVDLAGTVLRVFDAAAAAAGPSGDTSFVAATVSCTNQWLYGVTEDGALHVFSVETGKLETSIPSFGDETMRLSNDAAGAGGIAAEITSIVHHPNRSILAAFSNSKSQKKGQVVLWK
jgi:WD40 repeat-containing protein SMU1